MRIAHISDIHIRNLKFHSEYRKVFDNFYQKLEDLKIDLVVNTGDTAHTKTTISPEFVDMTSDFVSSISGICPSVHVLGNHDLNLMNSDRQNALTPIFDALNLDNVSLLDKSGPWKVGELGSNKLDRLVFWNFGIADVGNWPRAPYEKTNPDEINIGLFHGSIRNCLTDSLFRMTNVEYDYDIFEGLEFVMLGDIHKRQSFNNMRAWYAGSMIQQNFGEDTDKGFLVWDIEDKDHWNVEFVELTGARKFYTVRLPEDLVIPEMSIEPGSRVRIAPPRQMTLVEQKAVEKLVKKKFNPHDVITLGVQNIGQMFHTSAGELHNIENLRDMGVQESLLKQYVSTKNLSVEVMNKILDMNRKYQVSVEQKEAIARGVNWRVLKMGWNNLYNYGEGNIIDFSQIKGLTGIFAPNASGKSGMIDVLTVGAWDANTKEVAKNINLINDNKDKAVIILEMMANGERYTIQRDIERIKVGQRKGNEKEWGKTSLDFIRHDRDGGIEKLVGELRPQTEANITRRFGSFEDFMLTGLFAQWDPMDIIMCKETERKRILFRFLDLDIFEDKAKLAKDEFKEWSDKLAVLEDNGYERILGELQEAQTQDGMQLTSWEDIKSAVEQVIADNHEKIEELAAKIAPVSFSFRKIEANSLTKFENEIQALGVKLDDKLSELRELQTKSSNLVEEMSDYNAEYINKQIEKLEEMEAALFSVQAGYKEKVRLVDDRKKQAALLEKVPCGDGFPDCQFLVNAFKAKEELPEYLKETIELDIEAQKLRADILKLQPYREMSDANVDKLVSLNNIAREMKVAKLEADNINLTIEKMEAELREARLELERYEQAKKELEHNDVIQHEIGELKEVLAENEKGLKAWENKISELHQTMGARKTDIDRIVKQLDTIKEVRDACSAFEHFLNAMGKDGIALQVLTQKLPIINEEINKILTSAAEFGVFIEYEPEDQSIRLFLQYGQYKSRLLELGSGAEKFLASVAIRAALLSISNLPRSNMFIIDEGFGKLDPNNLEAIQRMFDYLRSVFDHVIVISHTDVMKDFCDNMIDITQDDEGYAHVCVGE